MFKKGDVVQFVGWDIEEGESLDFFAKEYPDVVEGALLLITYAKKTSTAFPYEVVLYDQDYDLEDDEGDVREFAVKATEICAVGLSGPLEDFL